MLYLIICFHMIEVIQWASKCVVCPGIHLFLKKIQYKPLIFAFTVVFLPWRAVNLQGSPTARGCLHDTTAAILPLSAVVRGATMLSFAYIRLSQQGCLLRDNEASSDSGHL